jgi:hypothetical protein
VGFGQAEIRNVAVTPVNVEEHPTPTVGSSGISFHLVILAEGVLRVNQKRGGRVVRRTARERDAGVDPDLVALLSSSTNRRTAST